MSRDIDVDNLTADDVRYLQERPWLIQEAELSGADDIRERMEEALAAEPEKDPYEGLGLPELREQALSRGVDLEGARTKKAITAKLREQDEADAEAAPDPNAPDHQLPPPASGQ